MSPPCDLAVVQTRSLGEVIGALTHVRLAEGAAAQLGVGPTLRLRRAWPRAGERLDLEFTDPDGQRIAGQWLPSAAQRRERAQATTANAVHRDDVVVLDDEGMLLQARGADRRLPALGQRLARTAGRLVSHRPERRAVVAHRGPTGEQRFDKVVRPGRADAVAQAGRIAARCPGVRAPQLREVDADAGLTTWSAVSGVPLDAVLDDDRAAAVLAEVGRTVVRLSAGTAACTRAGGDGDGLSPHVVADEIAQVDRWLAALAQVAPHTAARLAVVADDLRRSAPADAVGGLVHRDLHDGQIIVDREGRVGVIDFDTLSLGDSALDLGNLLGHLDLQHARGRLTADRTAALADALLTGAEASTAQRQRTAWYRRATRLRLCGVHAFRPDQAAAVAALVDDLTTPSPTRELP